MRLRPEDIADSKLTSGYRYVNREDSLSDRSVRNHPYRAQVQRGQHRSKKWRGPRRATALEAAWDYCSIVNNGFVAPAPTLKSAGHKRATPATRRSRKPTKRQQRITELRAELRKLEAKEREGRVGTIYLIGERYPTAFPPRKPDKVNISTYAVKIGYTEKDDRIAGLQTGNPRGLVLLAERPGTRADEAALHAQFIGDNVLGEWFRPTLPLLLEFGLREAIRGIDRIQVEGVSI